MPERTHLSINFNDIVLPVIKLEDNHDRVPFKTIVDSLGIDWKTQKRKLVNDDYFNERLGLVLGEANHPDMVAKGVTRDQYLIRVDRVVSFLNLLNPTMIRSQGNESSATWLESKHTEWDDALHQYENYGIAIKKDQTAIVALLGQVDRMKSPALKAAALANINSVYQLDIKLPEQGGAS